MAKKDKKAKTAEKKVRVAQKQEKKAAQKEKKVKTKVRPGDEDSDADDVDIDAVLAVIELFDLRLSEERIHLPELVLLELVERMVVTLRALHGHAEENL